MKNSRQKEVFEDRGKVFSEKYQEDILNIDLHGIVLAYKEAGKKLFGKAKAIETVRSKLQAYVRFPLSPDSIPSVEKEVNQFKADVDALNAVKNSVPAYWEGYFRQDTSVEEIEKLHLEWEQQFAVIMRHWTKIRVLKEKGDFEEVINAAKELSHIVLEMELQEKELYELLGITSFADKDEWLAGKRELASLIKSNTTELRDWIGFQKYKNECVNAGMRELCNLYCEGLDHDKVIPVYFKSLFRLLIRTEVEKEPVLNSFVGNEFNEIISHYSKMEKELSELTKEEMYYKLTHNLPTGYESSEMNKELAILRKAITSGGRGMSIRALFQQIPEVIRKLCPCLLMSPISVAQYLSSGKELYDIVVFDEASQLPTCKAVGVLARGKNAVIVGDPNQMPPTSFFAGNMIDEDNLEIEDLDSILDDCLALGLPEAHLHWHYRSRHESLIAFSNQEYYDNSMLTFPSINDRDRKVRLVTVNGMFDRKRGRINEKEGKAVVREVLRRFQTEDLMHQSVGIVTFNITQQGYIEDLLVDEFKKNADFERWANEKDECLFVKNLENVQGDERDVILFSIGFGPDENGIVSHNFGPLNKEGGWKRLNVAVTRARMEMIVFSSMLPESINLNRTKAKGVEGLRSFLEFAQKGKLHVNQERSESAQGITDSICSVLQKSGMNTQKNVGHSAFKIDIAVENPYDENEYLLGILLDGKSYQRIKNTKDREISQISVLESLGWRLYRIWTMDWWDNKEKEIAKLTQVIEREKLDAREKAFKKTKDKGPQSEDLDPAKREKAAPHNQKKKEVTNGIMSFDIRERFVAKIPHTNSMDELKEFLQKKAESTDQDTVISGYRYELVHYEEAVLGDVAVLTTSEYMDRENQSAVKEVLYSIIEKEAPISLDYLLTKALRFFHIGRSKQELYDFTEKLLKSLDVSSNKQAGIRFYWKNGQDPTSYPYYRIEERGADKRLMRNICQQELKNAVCITLQEKGCMGKDMLIKETVRTMGYARSGATIVEAVERGLKYGCKTGEIVCGTDKQYTLKK